MDNIFLKYCDFASKYINDLFIFSHWFKNYVRSHEVIFKRFAKYYISINFEKTFTKYSLKFDHLFGKFFLFFFLLRD